MASESISHSAFGLMGYWLRGIIVKYTIRSSFNDVIIIIIIINPTKGNFFFKHFLAEA